MPTTKTRPEGSYANLVTVAKHCTKHAGKHLPELRIRQLRNVLARPREIQRATALGNLHPDFVGLMMKRQRVVSLPPDSIDNHAALVLSMIERQQVLAKQERIQTWEHELRTSQQRTYCWLRGAQEPIAMNLHNGAQPAQTMQQCLQLLKEYWSGIWNRTCPNHDETVAAMRPHLGPAVPSVHWEPISPQMPFDIARSQKGKSAGLDGFSGTEVASLPLVVWRMWRLLFTVLKLVDLHPWRGVISNRSTFRNLVRVYVNLTMLLMLPPFAPLVSFLFSFLSLHLPDGNLQKLSNAIPPHGPERLLVDENMFLLQRHCVIFCSMLRMIAFSQPLIAPWHLT
eukprot:s11_g74.t1